MTSRKKKLRLIQLILLITGIIIIFSTYYKKENVSVTQKNSELIKKENQTNAEIEDGESDVFFNIEYTGLDLNGNRYILRSEEAQLENERPEIVYMKVVHATFYFKDNTTLTVWSDKGIYNNKTLDMQFSDNVRAEYLYSKLFAEKANYSNSENYLSISENVRINSEKGDLIADKLLFDITKQNLDITSFKDNKVNANLKLNEKRF
tara:strand:- start:6450 stop:7067 length:618 start_codon:yes stop_codon:yes gene_type:complete